MLNNYDTANKINVWLTVLAADKTKDIQSVSITNDGDPYHNGAYVIAVVLYNDIKE